MQPKGHAITDPSPGRSPSRGCADHRVDHRPSPTDGANRGSLGVSLIDPRKMLHKQRNLHMLTIRPLVWMAVLMLVAPAWAQNVDDGAGTLEAPAWARNVQDGMSIDDVETEVATPTGMNFDPPCAFSATLPLMAAPYMDPSTQSHVVDGEGAVLNQCSNFGVSGFSAPNFLAWNCNARNVDGTRPVLPAEIKFLRPMSRVSVKVGSSANAGSTATLRVYNAAHSQIGSTSVSLTPAMQTLSVGVVGIRYAILSGPCVMVADDLVYAP